MLVDCIHTAKDSVKLLVRSGIPIIFDSKRRYPFRMGTPSAGAQNTPGVGIFFNDFRLKSPFISETDRDRPKVVMKH